MPKSLFPVVGGISNRYITVFGRCSEGELHIIFPKNLFRESDAHGFLLFTEDSASFLSEFIPLFKISVVPHIMYCLVQNILCLHASGWQRHHRIMSEKASNNSESKKKLSFPHAFVLIFFIALIAAVMANIIPAGVYDRALDEATGRMVVVADSFHYVDKIGCSPFGFFAAFPEGFVNTADIFFFIIFAYFFVRTLMKNGTFDALVG